MVSQSIARPQMTADEARLFDRFSIFNATMVAETAVEKGCDCQPYTDWFTYSRWQAQGFQVMKGERGTKLVTWIERNPKEGEDPNKSHKFPKTTTVFCRCQVTEKGGNA